MTLCKTCGSKISRPSWDCWNCNREARKRETRLVLFLGCLIAIGLGVITAAYGEWAYGDWECGFKECRVIKDERRL